MYILYLHFSSRETPSENEHQTEAAFPFLILFLRGARADQIKIKSIAIEVYISSTYFFFMYLQCALNEAFLRIEMGNWNSNSTDNRVPCLPSNTPWQV